MSESGSAASLPMSLRPEELEAAQRVFEETVKQEHPFSFIQNDKGEIVESGFITLPQVKECLGKLCGKKPSQAVLYDLVQLAASAESVHFDLATFCRIYVEYMCAGGAMLLLIPGPHAAAMCSYLERQEQERKQNDYNDG